MDGRVGHTYIVGKGKPRFGEIGDGGEGGQGGGGDGGGGADGRGGGVIL